LDVYEAIKTRSSIRAFKPDPVERKTLLRLIEAARLAPSASNRQEWRFIIVTDAQKRKRLMEAARGQRFVGEAPAVIVACAETDEHQMTCGQLCYPIDVAIAVDHITLAAVAEGLGTCWIGAFFEAPVKELLGIPQDVRVVALLPVGYPAAGGRPKSRLALEKIVCWEKWEL